MFSRMGREKWKSLSAVCIPHLMCKFVTKRTTEIHTKHVTVIVPAKYLWQTG